MIYYVNVFRTENGFDLYGRCQAGEPISQHGAVYRLRVKLK